MTRARSISVMLSGLSAAILLPGAIRSERTSVVYAQAPVQSISDGAITPGRLSAISSRVLSTVQTRLGVRLKQDDLVTRLCSNEASYRDAGGVPQTEACYLAPNKILLRGQQGLSGVLAHEFCHVLINQVSHGRCPKWLDEGIVNQENHITANGQYSPRVRTHLQNALRRLDESDADWSLPKLCGDVQRSRRINDAFYGASLYATEYLYRTYGREAVLAALRDMNEMSPDEALRRNLGKDLKELERDWKAGFQP